MANPTTHRIDSEADHDEAGDLPPSPTDLALPDIRPRIRVPLRLQVLGVAAGLGAALILFAVTGGSSRAPSTSPADVDTAGSSLPEAPANSLGIRFDEFRERWNALDQPPFIARPLSRVPENGPYDSFSHRFDPSAVVAGAYDPANDYIVAIMVRASIDHPAISNMYLHLCYLLDPYSPECIDNYFTTGLAGRTLEELSQAGHQVSWTYQGNEWQVSVAANIETIRVTAPNSK